MQSQDQKPNQADADEAAGHNKPEHAEEETRRRHDELLDEGVEETFPASDPVSVKHIT
jgi:hypothetical protein